MAETYDTRNFVAADPQLTPIPRAELVRRQDVVHVVDRVIDAYQEQSRAALATVRDDTTRGGFLSDAGQVAERRKTSRMYLLTYAGVSGLTMGGLALVARMAGVDEVVSLAGWMFATGALTLVLAWLRHGDEFRHSPEGIARHIVDAHWSLSEYEAETRRKAIAWEHQAEARRQAAATQAAADARQMAALRMRELDTRRRATDADRERRHEAQVTCTGARVEQSARSSASSSQQVLEDPGSTVAALGASSTVVEVEHWQAALTEWVVALYNPGATTENGIVKGRVPWAARSNWTESDKREAKRVCCDMHPKLIVQADGGRWRLRREMFTNVSQALHVLSLRL